MADKSTGGISEEAGQLTKFHGLYLQDDRDQRIALKRAGKEKAFSFMLRVRLPGGRATTQQWLTLDKLSRSSRPARLRCASPRGRTFQFHGVLKGNVKPLVKGMHAVLLDSIAACGDVNRNVMSCPNPERNPVLMQVHEHAKSWSDYALPKTHAYHEIWLDDEMVAGGEQKEPSRCTAIPTCRASSRPASPSRPPTTSTSSRRTSASSRSSRTTRSSATTSRSAAGSA